MGGRVQGVSSGVVTGAGVGKRRDTSAKGALDVRLMPHDRVGGTVDGRRRRAAQPGPADDGRNRARPKPGGGTKRKRFGFRRVVYWIVVLAIWGIVALACLFAWVAGHLPPIQSLEIPKRPPSIQINAVDGRCLRPAARWAVPRCRCGRCRPTFPRRSSPSRIGDSISTTASIRSGMMRAVVANVLHHGISQGGSTITQQLAKNLFLTPERHLMRKLQEAVLALWLEHKFTKSEIIELYLNRVYFGSGAYGVEGAAQRYFGKSARQVTPAEAAMLAGLVKSPSRLAPTTIPTPPSGAPQVVLTDMAEQKLIGEDTAKAAMARSGACGATGRRRLGQLRRRLGDGRGQRAGRPVDQDIVIETTIDPTLQDRRRTGAGRRRWPRRATSSASPRRAGGDDAGRRSAGAGRRAQLRREPVQSRRRGQAPAGLDVQAVRLSDRAGARADAGYRARRRADRGERLEAGKFRSRISRPGDADAGARQFAQHGVGAADAGIRARLRWCAPPTGWASPPNSSRMLRSRSAPRKCRCWNWCPPMRRSPMAGSR